MHPTDEPELYPIKPPTESQMGYALDLAEQMREAGIFEAEKYARGIKRCRDRKEMSRLIGEMVELLEEERNSTGRYSRFSGRRCNNC